MPSLTQDSGLTPIASPDPVVQRRRLLAYTQTTMVRVHPGSLIAISGFRRLSLPVVATPALGDNLRDGVLHTINVLIRNRKVRRRGRNRYEVGHARGSERLEGDMAGFGLPLAVGAGNDFLADTVHQFHKVRPGRQYGPDIATSGVIMKPNLGTARNGGDLLLNEFAAELNGLLLNFRRIEWLNGLVPLTEGEAG